MHILLIEDDSDLADAISAAFARHDIGCDLARNAREGEHRLQTNDYAAVILDLGLPDEHGLILLRRFRSAGQDLPVIILTARSDSNTRIEGFEAGADDFLNKPFLFQELRARLNAVLRREARAKTWVGERRWFEPPVATSRQRRTFI